MLDFDITTAIAKLENGEDTVISSSYEDLRARYPELSFLFDRIADFEEAAKTHCDQSELDYAEDRAQNFEHGLDECEARFAQLRDMAKTLSRMDNTGISFELRKLANLADDGQVWVKNRIETSE